MQYNANTPDEYIEAIPEERREAMQNLRRVITENLPQGFSEVLNYGMIGYTVPHEIYPNGYHCDPKLPLPFINIASQKNFIAVYHMGIYADKELMDWFINEHPKYVKTKLDMGKSCIRFKKTDQIPLKLIGELVAKMTPEKWIEIYETTINKN